MNPQYRFYIQIDDNSTRYQAYPIYGSDLSKNYSKESNQMFFRDKLDGKLKFVKSDFARIMDADFDSVTHVYIEARNDNKTWTEFFHGKFMRTDCTINASEQWLETKLEPVDNYEDVLAGLDKEFNLIELAPEIERVDIFKRPAVQIYVTDTDVVTTFVGGLYFEQQSTGKYTDDDMDKFHFLLQREVKYIIINTSGSGKSGYEGSYYKISDTEYVNLETRVKIVMEESAVYVYYDPAGTGLYSVLLSSDGYYMTDNDGFTYILFEAARQSDGLVFKHGSSSINNGGQKYASIYARLILDTEMQSEPTYEIPVDDIVENNRNYKRCAGINVDSNIVMSVQLSSSPTEWGIYQPGLYYVKPRNVYTKQFYPIGRSTWSMFSLWMTPFMLDYMYNPEAIEKYTLRHAYPISSCIQVLLSQISPDLEFKYSSSSFINQKGNNYNNVNPVSGIPFEILITQKTNILKGEYDQPAQKAMITLKQIFEMLRDCFQCYWYLDSNELKIEHISYFQNGLLYPGWDGVASINTDLTTLLDSRVKKQWERGYYEYTFNKEEMPEWYQFEWADDVSLPFKGYPIEIISNYVKKGNIKTISVNKFVSDIDLMLLNPSSFNEEGLVLLVAVRSDSSLELPFVNKALDGYDYSLQNGYAAFCDLQERYYIRSLPAKKVVINKIQKTVKPTRSKKQEVEYPTSSLKPNIYSLVKTSLGNGQIEDMKINLSSRMAKVTLMHDTE